MQTHAHICVHMHTRTHTFSLMNAQAHTLKHIHRVLTKSQENVMRLTMPS